MSTAERHSGVCCDLASWISKASPHLLSFAQLAGALQLDAGHDYPPAGSLLDEETPFRKKSSRLAMNWMRTAAKVLEVCGSTGADDAALG